MPIHDWTRVGASVFHDFRLHWVVHLAETLNKVLPPDFYALVERRSNTPCRRGLSVRHTSDHRKRGLVQIVSPGNKDSPASVVDFVDQVDFALRRHRIHVLLSDLFALILVSCGGRAEITTIEQLAVGDPLPDMPLFLTADHYIPLPLAATYDLAYNGMPEFWREVLEGRRAVP